MSDKFQTHAWTEAAVEELFGSNKAFRQTAITAAKKVSGDSSAGKDEGLALAKAMVGLSTKIGERLSETRITKSGKDTGTKKYPHPGYLLWWLRKIKDYDLSGFTPNGSMPGLNSHAGAMIFNLIRSIHVPGRMANSWSKFMKDVNFAENKAPYFFKTSVHALPTKSSGSMRGFLLKSLTVRVPVGIALRPVTRNDPRYSEYVKPHTLTPRGAEFMKIDLAKFVDDFGEVWLAVSNDGKSVFLTSQKKCTMTLSEFLNKAMEIGAVSGPSVPRIQPGKFSEWPYPGSSWKKKVPSSVQNLLSKKLQSQKDLKGPFRGGVDIDR